MRIPASFFRGGFTLIELLITCSIIGIIAAIVLVSVHYARLRAHDTRVRTSVNQFRSFAEIYFSSNQSSYLGFDACITTPNATNCLSQSIASAVTDLKADIENQNGMAGSVAAASNIQNYCLSGPLRTDATVHVCIDSTGVMKDIASACGGSFACN
jgi:prepilin-type N-terminal cleavage/methylation domain-containing protein